MRAQRNGCARCCLRDDEGYCHRAPTPVQVKPDHWCAEWLAAHLDVELKDIPMPVAGAAPEEPPAPVRTIARATQGAFRR